MLDIFVTIQLVKIIQSDIVSVKLFNI